MKRRYHRRVCERERGGGGGGELRRDNLDGYIYQSEERQLGFYAVDHDGDIRERERDGFYAETTLTVINIRERQRETERDGFYAETTLTVINIREREREREMVFTPGQP